MAEITMMYRENENDGLPYGQTITITRKGVEEIPDVLDFISEALKAVGYSGVDKIGYSTAEGDEFWSKW